MSSPSGNSWSEMTAARSPGTVGDVKACVAYDHHYGMPHEGMSGATSRGRRYKTAIQGGPSVFSFLFRFHRREAYFIEPAVFS